VAEILASAWGRLDGAGDSTREQAQDWLRAQGYAAGPVKVPSHWMMFAGQFVPLLHVDDHPLDDIYALALQVSVPASIEDFVQRRVPAGAPRRAVPRQGAHRRAPRLGAAGRAVPSAAGRRGDRAIEADVLDVEFLPCDMIIANYTVQFLPPRVRQVLIDQIYRALNWGGAFFMFEKVRAPDGRFQDYASQAYVEYKLDQGFTEAEILNKSRSIKGVMEPFSSQGNADMLRRAGFEDLVTVHKYVCFEGFLAIK
jgi:hypothetical protein